MWLDGDELWFIFFMVYYAIPTTSPFKLEYNNWIDAIEVGIDKVVVVIIKRITILYSTSSNYDSVLLTRVDNSLFTNYLTKCQRVYYLKWGRTDMERIYFYVNKIITST